MKCPICAGKGQIEDPHHKDIDEAAARRVMARALHAEGYSFRQIAKLIGWKSVRSVSLALEEAQLARKLHRKRQKQAGR